VVHLLSLRWWRWAHVLGVWIMVNKLDAGAIRLRLENGLRSKRLDQIIFNSVVWSRFRKCCSLPTDGAFCVAATRRLDLLGRDYHAEVEHHVRMGLVLRRGCPIQLLFGHLCGEYIKHVSKLPKCCDCGTLERRDNQVPTSVGWPDVENRRNCYAIRYPRRSVA